MVCFSCASNSFRSASKAMAKAASARLRQIGVGSTAANWSARAEICERCPMRVLHRGESYCGKPFLHQIDRDPVVDGCGCPTHDKAKAPEEHCPVTTRFSPSHISNSGCNCKWCTAL